MNTSMKAAVIKQWGNADTFELMQVPIPKLEADDVLIKVAYAGINPADWKIRAGYLESFLPNTAFPLVIGLDASGVVVAIGENVVEHSEGDRVVSASDLFTKKKPGSYAQYLVVNTHRVASVPADMTLESAATLPIAGITAFQALFASDKGALQKGEDKKILINGASGGVGSFAVQFAKWAGAEVATTCSGVNLEYVKSLGADFLIDYKTQQIGDKIIQWAPEGVDLLIDAISGNSLADPIAFIKQGGKLISIATLTEDGDVEASITAAKERGVTKIYALSDDSNLGEDLRTMLDIIQSGGMRLPPTESFELDDITLAHRKLEEGHVRGKLVLRISGEL